MLPRPDIVWEGQRGRQRLAFSERVHVMGILNVTPDSFSDGGLHFDARSAYDRAMRMLDEGADIIDVGGESTRPGAQAVSEDEERRRVVPVIERLRARSDCLISIDTCKSRVAKEALEAGADMVNDISAMRFDARMMELVAGRACPVILMHIQGTPRDMQHDPTYGDVVRDVRSHLAGRLDEAERAGIDHNVTIVDPGIGFGKTVEHNLALFARLEELSPLGRPLLLGASRKSVIGAVLDLPVTDRLEGTLAVTALAAAAGAAILRVHDVAANVRACRMAEAVANAKVSADA